MMTCAACETTGVNPFSESLGSKLSAALEDCKKRAADVKHPPQTLKQNPKAYAARADETISVARQRLSDTRECIGNTQHGLTKG